jgi:hypothetical protein
MASDTLSLGSQEWAAVLSDDIIPMVSKLSRAVSAQVTNPCHHTPSITECVRTSDEARARPASLIV